eukprot:gene16145-19212_t
MKGIGTDESALIKVIANRCWEEKKAIIHEFNAKFGKDLIKEIKSEVSGNLENALIALMTEPAVFDYDCLLEAMKGAGTNESTLIEILVTRSNSQIAKISHLFEHRQSKSLEKWVTSETSGDFKKLCEYLLDPRDESQMVDPNLAKADADQLYHAGEEVDRIYGSTRKHTLSKAIDSEFSGNIKKALLAIVDYSRNPYEYFATLLHESMAGVGTNDKKLIRVLVTQAHLIEPIKTAYAHKFGRSLKHDIEKDCSGDYKKLLIDLINA